MIVFELAGSRWTEDDLTLLEIAEVERVLGKGINQIKPKGLVTDALAIITVLLSRDKDPATVKAIIEKLKLPDFEAIVTVTPDIVPGMVASDDLPDAWEDGLPLEGRGAGTTGGSSGAPDASVGLPA